MVGLGTGKSTFCETLAACFGDYAATVQGSRVAGEDHQHLQWLAGLSGKRLLYVDEVPERGKWRTDVLSTMIEGGTLEAHKMRQNSFNFQSTLQVIITGNFKPRANAVGGIWRRLRMIEFQNVPDEVNPHLGKELRANLPGVFAWIHKGLARWIANGRRLRLPM